MDGCKLQRRHAAQNPVRFVLSMVVLTAALLITSVAVPAFERAEMAGFAASGRMMSHVRDYLRNPLDYFAQRSPGARGSGQLIQSKQRIARLGHRGEKPHEQVLSNSRYPSSIPDYIDDLVPNVGLSLVETNEPVSNLTRSPFAHGTPNGLASVVPVSVPGSAPDGGTAPSPVPEPATWLTRTWGMGLIGFCLRSQYRCLHITAREAA